MRIISNLVCLSASLLCVAPAFADSPVVKWKDVVGIVQAQNGVGSGTGRVTGGAQPWTTSGGLADVDLSTGRVHFVVKGLVFAGGNAIGTRGSIAEVKGTLVCDTDGSAGGGNSVLVDTDLVGLSPQGDADFNGFVALPQACGEPDIAFVVRTSGGAWIANGAIRTP